MAESKKRHRPKRSKALSTKGPDLLSGSSSLSSGAVYSGVLTSSMLLAGGGTNAASGAALLSATTSGVSTLPPARDLRSTFTSSFLQSSCLRSDLGDARAGTTTQSSLLLRSEAPRATSALAASSSLLLESASTKSSFASQLAPATSSATLTTSHGHGAVPTMPTANTLLRSQLTSSSLGTGSSTASSLLGSSTTTSSLLSTLSRGLARGAAEAAPTEDVPIIASEQALKALLPAEDAGRELPDDLTQFVDKGTLREDVAATDPLQDLKHSFLNCVAASLIGGPNFYNARDPTRMALLDLGEKIAAVDGEFLLKTALYVRQELNIRITANFLFALAAHRPGARNHLRRYVHKCINLPSDWIEVAQLSQTLNGPDTAAGSLPAALRKAMIKKFADFDEYQLAKYDKERPPPAEKSKKPERDGENDSDDEEALVQMSFSLKKLIRKLHIDEPVRHVMCLLGKRYPATAEEFHSSRLPGQFDPAMAGKRMRLKVPETWETQVSMKGNNASTWQTLMDHRKLPFMAMLRNLRNILLAGVAPRYHSMVIDKLTTEGSVITSRQFPFRFFSAYEVLQKIGEDPSQPQRLVGKGSSRGRTPVKMVKAPPKDLIDRYCKALDEAVRISTWFNVNPIRGRTLVLCNVGVELAVPCTSAKGLGKPREVREIAVLLSLMCMHACEARELLLYSNAMDPLFHHVTSPAPRDAAGPPQAAEQGTILQALVDVLREVAVSEGRHCAVCGCVRQHGQTWSQACRCSTCNTGCTMRLSEPAMPGFPLQTLQALLRDRQEVDNLLLFSNSVDLPPGLDDFLSEYRRTVNGQLLFVNCDLSGAKAEVASTSSRHPSDVTIAGYSDAILRFVADRGEGVGLVTYVDRIDRSHALDQVDAAAPAKRVRFGRKPRQPKGKAAGPASTTRAAAEEPVTIQPYPLPGPPRRVPTRCARVFISSTFKDMHGERDLLTRVVFPELRARARALHINVIEVDLRWGLTEEDTKSNRTLEICLREVDKCNFFVGLLGTRYGYVPDAYAAPDEPDFDWLKEYPPGRSVTELEMHRALYTGRRCFFFRRDESFAARVPKEFAADFESEGPASAENVRALRQRIALSDCPCFDYSATWGGVSEGKPVAGGLDELGAAAVEMLWDAILTQCDGEDLEGDALSEHDLFAHEQSEAFVGRQGLLETLASHMDGTPEGSSSFVVVTGRAGVGKTALLSAFAEHERRRHGSHALLVHFVGPIPDSNDIRKSLYRMCHALVSRLGPGYDVPQTFDELREFFPVALEAAARCSPTSRLLVIIDGINQFSEANGGQSLGWLPATLPPGVVFVVTTRDGPQDHVLKARKNITFVTVPVLTPADRQALVRTTLARYRKRLDESSFNNQLSLLTNKRDAALPLFLVVACEELRVGATFERLSDILRQLAAHVSGLFEQVLVRLENAHGTGLMSTVFKLFACARAGLRERDLLALIARAHPQRAAPAILARVFRSLEPFLVCSGSSRAFMLFHDEFAKAVNARYLSDTRDLAASHAFLVAQYKSLADPRGDGSFVGRDALALSELPYHLVMAGMHVDLVATLTSLGFIQAAAAAGVCHALIDAYTLPAHLKTTHVQDIQRALTSPAVCEFADFVSRNCHIFTLRPGLVFQQALNSPSTSAPARIAASMLNPHARAALPTRAISESLSRTTSVQRSLSGSTTAGAAATAAATATRPTSTARTETRPAASARTAKQQTVTRLAAADMPLIVHENKNEDSEPCVRTIAGLLQPVTALAVSPDNHLVAVGLRSGALSLYDTSNMRELWVISAHASTVTDLAFVDATHLCSSSADCTLALRQVADGSAVFVNRDAGRRVSGLAISHDAESVACSSWDATLRVVSLKDGKAVYSTKPGKRALGCIAHHPTTPVVASGDWSGTIYVIDYAAKSTRMLQAHSLSVRSVAFSPCGNYLMTAPGAGSLSQPGQDRGPSGSASAAVMWSARTLTKLGELDAHNAAINRIAFARGGGEIATVGDDHKINVWSGTLGCTLSHAPCSSDHGAGTAVAIGPDGVWLAAGYHHGTVRVMCVGSSSQLAPVCELHDHAAAVTCLAWREDQPLLASGSLDNTVVVYRHAGDSFVKLAVLRNHSKPVTSLAFSKCGSFLISTSLDLTCFVWDAAALLTAAPTALRAHDNGVMAVACTSSFVYTGGRDGALVVWALRGLSEQSRMNLAHSDWINALAASHDGSTLASAGNDMVTKIWSLGEPAHPVLTHTLTLSSPGVSLAFLDETLLAIGTNSTCSVWHPVLAYEVTHFSRPVASLAAFPAGSTRLALTGSAGLEVLDVMRGTLHATYTGHSTRVLSGVFGNKHLVTGSADGVVKFWLTSASIAPPAHSRPVSAAALFVTGCLGATADRGGEVRVWAAASRAEPLQMKPAFRAHKGAVTAMLFLPDARLVTVGHDHRLCAFELENPTSAPSAVFEAPVELECVAYCRETHSIAIAGWGGYVALVNAYTFQLNLVLREPSRTALHISSLLFTPAALLAASLDGARHQWATRGEGAIDTEPLPRYGAGWPHPHLVGLVAVDGRVLDCGSDGIFAGQVTRAPVHKVVPAGSTDALLACTDGTLRWWDLQSMEPRGQFTCRGACEVAAAAGGRVLAGDTLGHVYALGLLNSGQE